MLQEGGPQRLKPLIGRALTAWLKPCPSQSYLETNLIGDSLDGLNKTE